MTTEQVVKTVRLYAFTHGKHSAGGGTAKDYDGPLTEEARKQIGSVTIPEVDRIFCCPMKRHHETMGLADVDPQKVTFLEFMDDEAMFSAMDCDEEPIRAIEKWLDELKAEGIESVVVFGSRFLSALMFYIQKQLALVVTIPEFMNTMDALSKTGEGLDPSDEKIITKWYAKHSELMASGSFQTLMEVIARSEHGMDFMRQGVITEYEV